MSQESDQAKKALEGGAMLFAQLFVDVIENQQKSKNGKVNKPPEIKN